MGSPLRFVLPQKSSFFPNSTDHRLSMLQVRDVIEAERFMTPRISLRSEPAANGVGAAESRSPDGSSCLFEVLGAGRPESGQQAAPALAGNYVGVPSRGGSTSLETCPPPALDPRRWAEAVGADFMVRGASYLTNRVKVPSARQVRRNSILMKRLSSGSGAGPLVVSRRVVSDRALGLWVAWVTYCTTEVGLFCF